MKKLLLVTVFVAMSQASAQFLEQCPLKFAGSVVLNDVHHVGYILEVRNPTKKPIPFRVRIDFVYKGKKIQGGFEYEEGVIPPKSMKTFKGSEPFMDKLKGVDTMTLQLKKCDQ